MSDNTQWIRTLDKLKSFFQKERISTFKETKYQLTERNIHTKNCDQIILLRKKTF